MSDRAESPTMTADEQLAEWVKGNPIHNDNPAHFGEKDMEGGECCPDFSCCNS